jgi:predicted transposase YdaD
MPLRMLEYGYLIYCQHKREPYQLVLYVGYEKLSMESEIKLKNLYYRYRIIDIREIEADELLNSDSPEDVVMAILCRMAKPEKTIKEILYKLSTLPPKVMRDYILKLIYLSGLRRLDKIIREEVKKMPITIDVREHVLFQEGLEEGIEKGRKEDIIRLYTKAKMTMEDIANALEVDISFVMTTLKEAALLKD